MADKTILIADDETHILNVLSIKLKNAGYNVVTAQDGAEAYALACQSRPDMIITDYQMPSLSGLELCSKLQCDAMMSHVPIILLTARGFSMSEQDVASHNIKRILLKPFSPREILSRVQELLGECVGASVG